MSGAPDKAGLLEAFRASLAARAAALEAEIGAAVDGARVDGSHRPANRGERAAVTGAGYLALGIGQRLAELRDALDALDALAPGPRDRVAPGALVRVSGEDGERWLFVAPGGQGDALGEVTVVSPDAPIARALRGLRPGDEAIAVLGGREQALQVEGVA